MGVCVSACMRGTQVRLAQGFVKLIKTVILIESSYQIPHLKLSVDSVIHRVPSFALMTFSFIQLQVLVSVT